MLLIEILLNLIGFFIKKGILITNLKKKTTEGGRPGGGGFGSCV